MTGVSALGQALFLAIALILNVVLCSVQAVVLANLWEYSKDHMCAALTPCPEPRLMYSHAFLHVVHMYMHKYMLVLTHVHTRNFKDSEREATQHAKGNVHTPHACRNYYDVEKSIRRLLLPEQLIQVFQSACAWGGTAQHATPSASVFAA